MPRHPLPAAAQSSAVVQPPGVYAAAMAGVIALVAWVSLGAQTNITFHRMLWNGFDTFEAIVRLAAYLTNLTALLVALCFTCIALRVRAWPLRLLAGPAAVSAVTVYIVFVGIAFNVLLRRSWTPHGYHAVLSEAMHSVLPLLCAAYWLLFVPKFTLSARECLAWFVYPLAYLAVTFWHGSETDFYPYPFIDVVRLGYPHVIVNSALLFAAFVVLMLVVMTINAWRRPAVVAIGESTGPDLRHPD